MDGIKIKLCTLNSSPCRSYTTVANAMYKSSPPQLARRDIYKSRQPPLLLVYLCHLGRLNTTLHSHAHPVQTAGPGRVYEVGMG